MSPTAAAIAITLAVIGAAVQSSIGLGFGLVSSPILAIIDPDFVPAGILVATLPLSLWVAVRNRNDIDRHGFGAAIAGRVPGVALGALVAATVSTRWLALGLSAAVLIAVAVSVWSPPLTVTTTSSVVAGAMSGFMGTTTGVGGPPMALLYQRHDPTVVRATLAGFFTVGTAMSITALVIGGTLSGDGISAHQWRLGLFLLPGVAVGIAASRYLHRFMHGQAFRAILLVVCVLSATVLAVQQLSS